jgi:small subunit ribosomal protein S35
MAASLQSLRLQARSCACTSFPRQNAAQSLARRRLFSTTPAPLAKAKIDPEAQAATIEKAEQALGVNLRGIESDMEESRREVQEYLDADVDFGPSALEMPQSRKKLKETFLNMGEVEPFEDGDFAEDDEDDISSIAHGELEQHREWRHYARLAAWEMPLLSSKSFYVTTPIEW